MEKLKKDLSNKKAKSYLLGGGILGVILGIILFVMGIIFAIYHHPVYCSENLCVEILSPIAFYLLFISALPSVILQSLIRGIGGTYTGFYILLGIILSIIYQFLIGASIGWFYSIKHKKREDGKKEKKKR